MVFEENIKLIRELIELDFYKKLNIYTKKSVINAIYTDPDNHDNQIIQKCKTLGEQKGVRFSADGICGWKILYDVNDGKAEWLNQYELVRGSKYGEFFWPDDIHEGSQTINLQRSIVFGDRIDLTIYDIKRLILGEKTRLKFCESGYFSKFKEKKGFEQFCEEYELVDSFVNEKYQVKDLARDDGEIDSNLIDNFKWSNRYLIENKKKIMKKYIDNLVQICKNHPKIEML